MTNWQTVLISSIWENLWVLVETGSKQFLFGLYFQEEHSNSSFWLDIYGINYGS